MSLGTSKIEVTDLIKELDTEDIKKNKANYDYIEN